jgi:predicted DNA-binding transcriptional regulator YafY
LVARDDSTANSVDTITTAPASNVVALQRQPAIVDYTNWRGERRDRKIMPLGIHFGSNEWHPTRQWMLYALDIETGEERFFAMSNIHSWQQLIE